MTCAQILSPLSLDDVILQRLDKKGSNLHSINIPRYMNIGPHSIVQDSNHVAFAFHKQNMQKREKSGMLFPSALH
jgi:hypothetical protein